MKNEIKKIIKLRKQIEKNDEDKLNAIIWRGMCQHLIDKILEFDLYLLNTKNMKVIKEFEKVLKIIRDNEHLI